MPRWPIDEHKKDEALLLQEGLDARAKLDKILEDPFAVKRGNFPKGPRHGA